MKTNDENELLRSTGKYVEKRNGSANFGLRRKAIITSILLLVITFLVQTAAAFAPQEFVESSRFLKGWISLVSGLFPTVIDYERYSKFPLATALFLAVSISFFIIQTALFVLVFYFGAPKTGSAIPLKMIFLLLVSALIISSSLFFLPKDPAFSGIVGMNSSRLGLAFFGVGQFAFLSLIVSIFVSEINVVLKRNLS